MKKQTAVEWLVKKFAKYYAIHQLEDEIEQAKRMEKEQIINSYISSDLMEGRANLIDAEQYYKETYDRATDPDQNH